MIECPSCRKEVSSKFFSCDFNMCDVCLSKLGPVTLPTSPEVHYASNWKSLKITGDVGKIVGITQFKGDVIVAAEYGVFIYRPENNKLIPIEFEVEK